MQKTILFTALSAALLSGCASLTTDSDQSDTVDTDSTSGAQVLDNVSKAEGEVGQNQYNALRRQQMLAKKGVY